MASRIKSRESLENWGWQKLTSTAGRAFTIAASSYFHYSPFFELFSINIYPCSSRNFKGKEAPPPLEMLPDLSSLASLDGWPEIVPLFIAKPSNESPRTALSLLPMARVRLEFKRTVSDFKQVVIDPRCILYILKYRAKCEQTLHARKSRYTVRIFPPTYFTIRVFSTLRLHFHSGTRGVNNRRRQARVDRSIVGRVLYIYIRE